MAAWPEQGVKAMPWPQMPCQGQGFSQVLPATVKIQNLTLIQTFVKQNLIFQLWAALSVWQRELDSCKLTRHSIYFNLKNLKKQDTLSNRPAKYFCFGHIQ